MPLRFETRDIAEKVLSEFHNSTSEDGVKLLLRFADTKAQKVLKQQSNERRAYRAGEYNYSVEIVQGSTPSPSLHRLQQTASHLSPNSPLSFTSPVGVGSSWTPATSISPSYVYKKEASDARKYTDKRSSCAVVKNPANNTRLSSWSTRHSPGAIDNTPIHRGRLSTMNHSGLNDSVSAGSGKTVLPITPCAQPKSRSKSHSCSPKKDSFKSGSMSPVTSHKEFRVPSPRSTI